MTDRIAEYGRMTIDGATNTGLSLIHAEMRRQYDDARRSLENAGDVAAEIAASVRRTGRVRLLGMGGSHCVNRTAEAVLRVYGHDVAAVVASEALYAPFPDTKPVTRLLTSQSGESGEIVRILDGEDLDDTFGLTLDADSRLARRVPSLVGHGGAEVAYAATRSLTISLALMAAVAEALGHPQYGARAVLESSPAASIEAASATLMDCDAVIFCARGALNGIAEAGALGLLELARMPAFALEGGQFRHGPIEVLRPGIGIVLLRADDETVDLFSGLAAICVGAGVTPVVFDASGREPLEGCVTLQLTAAAGFAAALATLPYLQALLIEIAKTRVEHVGEPIRSQKVTSSE